MYNFIIFYAEFIFLMYFDRIDRLLGFLKENCFEGYEDYKDYYEYYEYYYY